MEKKEKKKRFARLRKVAGAIGIAALGFHLGTHLIYNINKFAHKINTTEQRRAFEEEFGFPIEGWTEDIEENDEYLNNNLSKISRVVAREQYEKPFTLRSIVVRSPNYLKKHLLDQVEEIITNGSGGYYVPIADILNVSNINMDTLHHEIKHDKTFDIIRDSPEFLEKWHALAVDGKGDSLYLNPGEQMCTRFRGLDGLVSEEKKNDNENLILGFISTYARTNVYEDIAELCEAVENLSGNSNLHDLLGNGAGRNERIIAKIALAQEYNLIPRDFTEFLELKSKMLGCYVCSMFDCTISSGERPNEFLCESDAFLKRNKKSIYEAEIRSMRGKIMKSYAERGNRGDKDFSDAIMEYKRALNLEFKEPSGYSAALWGLSELFLESGDFERSSLYRRAFDYSLCDEKGGGVKFHKVGINDFLIANGEDLSGL